MIDIAELRSYFIAMKPEQIKDLRKRRSLTQKQFGNVIGKTARAIRKYEKGETPISDSLEQLINHCFPPGNDHTSLHLDHGALEDNKRYYVAIGERWPCKNDCVFTGVSNDKTLFSVQPSIYSMFPGPIAPLAFDKNGEITKPLPSKPTPPKDVVLDKTSEVTCTACKLKFKIEEDADGNIIGMRSLRSE